MRTALDFYFYSEKTLPGALLLDISQRELYSRVTIAAAFLLTGIIISRAVNRLKASERRARRLDQCVRSVRTINQLVTRVRDRSTLCQRSCDELVTGLGYERVQARLDGVTRGCAELPHTDTGAQAASASEPVTIPIICGGERFGELIVTPGRETAWDAEERALLNEVAEDIAFSVAMMSVSERLGQQREEVQTILDSVSAYISYKDRGGRYIRVNKALADLAHIPQQDWTGKTFTEIMPTCEEVGAYADEEVLATGRASHSPLEALELPAETRWIQSHRVPYRDNNGTVVGVIALSVDVTDRMEAERALACKDEQLRQSQKMEAIGQLAGGIAHDFNNLLTAISGYTELARAELEPSSSASEMLFAVSKAADRAADLTRQLLAFGRKQPLRLAELDLNDVVSGMTDMLERLIGARAGGDEPRRQRPGRHASRWEAHDQHIHGRSRRAVSRRKPRRVRPRLRLPSRGRHRRGHGPQDNGTDLRAILHHQETGCRNRTGAFCRRWNSGTARGLGRRPEQTGARNELLRIPAGGARAIARGQRRPVRGR
jgi:PAS domain S-box-containing protein